MNHNNIKWVDFLSKYLTWKKVGIIASCLAVLLSIYSSIFYGQKEDKIAALRDSIEQKISYIEENFHPELITIQQDSCKELIMIRDWQLEVLESCNQYHVLENSYGFTKMKLDKDIIGPCVLQLYNHIDAFDSLMIECVDKSVNIFYERAIVNENTDYVSANLKDQQKWVNYYYITDSIAAKQLKEYEDLNIDNIEDLKKMTILLDKNKETYENYVYYDAFFKYVIDFNDYCKISIREKSGKHMPVMSVSKDSLTTTPNQIVLAVCYSRVFRTF